MFGGYKARTMDSARIAEGIEWLTDVAAASCLAVAAAYAAWTASAGDQAISASAAALGFLVAYVMLRRVTVERSLDLPMFAVADLAPAADDALLLDDAIGGIDTSLQIVRLFAPGDAPTPGQLVQRIDAHRAGGTVSAENPADALHAALADIRRSLR